LNKPAKLNKRDVPRGGALVNWRVKRGRARYKPKEGYLLLRLT